MAQQMMFDLYQRYRFIEHVISILAPETSASILEVGAAGSPLGNSLKNGRIVLLDSVATTSTALDVRGSGMRLPFRDRAFDVVVCSDTLEHVERSNRMAFVGELWRVTYGSLILGFPHAEVHNIKADEIFLQFVKQHGRREFEHLENYLQEHDAYGLPERDDIRKQLNSFGGEVLEVNNSNLFTWLLFQLGHFTLLQQPEFAPIRELFNEHFVRLESSSHTAPFYRTIFVASRHRLQEETGARLQSLIRQSCNGAEENAARSVELITAFANIAKEKDSEIRDQKAVIEQLQDQIYQQKTSIRNLENYLNLFFQHPAYKVYKSAKRTLKKLLHFRRSPLEEAEYLLYQRAFDPGERECQKQAQLWPSWNYKPGFSIVTAVFDPAPRIFEQTADSVLRQTYGNWTWNVVDASKTDAIWKQLVHLSAKDSRIQPQRLSENLGISGNLNAALRQASGEFIVILDHDDLLAVNALYEVAEAICHRPDLDFLYSDSDKLDENGRRCEPLFKPDWSPELMLSCNLLNQISVFRRSLLDQVGYLNSNLDGAQDWDLYFRITERTGRIHHIPKILYHWRKSAQSTAQSIGSKPYAKKAQIAAIANHLQRTGIQQPHVSFLPQHKIHKTYPVSRWAFTRNWAVSIIIPTKDRVDLLKKCLDSVTALTSYKNYEIVLVDTGSTDAKTSEYYRQIQSGRIRLTHCDGSFNFGKACNTGASNAKGEMFLFLNNDTEVLEEEWLDRMLQWFERPGVGVVGAKLLYPNGRVQHAGVILGIGGLAGHIFTEERENTFGFFGTDGWYRNLSAVTGACLMIPRDLYERIGGFDETFQLIYSDVQLCLRATDLGYRVVYTPEARLLHHESATHHRRIPRVDFENATRKWKQRLEKGDPFFNPNLTCGSSRPVLRMGKETPVALNELLMQKLPQKEIILLPGDLS